jgi:hypothetical protein
MHTLILGGKSFVVDEPVFRELKIILAALNRLNNPTYSDFDLVADVQAIITALIGGDNVAKFRRFCWEAWKIPTPNPSEITALLAAIPAICGLQKSSSSNESSADAKQADDWDALYWRIIRQTGWTWETVDTTMTISRLNSLSESLNVTPSADSMIAAYLGYEYKKPESLEDKIDAWLALNPTQH